MRIDDEYKAEATYAAVVESCSPVRPFINIVDAERRHIEEIKGRFRRLGWDISPNPRPGKVEPPLTRACEAAVQAEVDNIALHDRLFPEIAVPGVHHTLSNLQHVSRENHRLAFGRCPSRESR